MTRTRRPRRGRLLAAVALVALGLLTGCRGVPTSSAPQKVKSVGLGQGQPPPIAPQPGEGPREIVRNFLDANGSGGPRSSSLSFLTKSEQNSWSDSTAKIVTNLVYGTYDADSHTLIVTGRIVGTLDKNGIYSPTGSGTGQGGQPQAFKFGITTAHGENRISSAPSGLLLTTDQFDSAYQARVLYFYDSVDKYLVPDIRYSSIEDPATLADWLLAQLVNGPRSTLATAVSTDTLPTHVQDPQAKVGAVTRVEIDGARQLSAAARNRLAAQVSATLRVPGIDELTVIDGRSRVLIPQIHGTEFSATNFEGALGPPSPGPTLYYLKASGRIKRADGSAQLGEAGGVAFNSIALARPPQIGKLTVAGVQGTNLYVAAADRPWPPSRVALPSAPTSRPAWAPGRNEVWIAAGANLYRIVTDGRTNKVYKVALPPGSPSETRIAAVRFSPDGSRIALVFASAAQDGGQLYVSSVLRNGSVSIAGLAQSQISPQDVRITDVAWADSLKLIATGYTTTTKDAGIFETRADGADWTDLGLTSLPGKANTITATTGAPAWVDTNGYVWQQNGTDWLSPTSQDQTEGSAPMYLG